MACHAISPATAKGDKGGDGGGRYSTGAAVIQSKLRYTDAGLILKKNTFGRTKLKTEREREKKRAAAKSPVWPVHERPDQRHSQRVVEKRHG